MRMRLAVSMMRPAIFKRRRRMRGELGVPQRIPTRDCSAQVEQQPVGGGVQDEPHLVGQRRAAAGAIGGELGLVLLDQVLGLPAGAVERFINLFGIACLAAR